MLPINLEILPTQVKFNMKLPSMYVKEIFPKNKLILNFFYPSTLIKINNFSHLAHHGLSHPGLVL
jgi:hypothetical protein